MTKDQQLQQISDLLDSFIDDIAAEFPNLTKKGILLHVLTYLYLAK